jgi:hypothetical protein
MGSRNVLGKIACLMLFWVCTVLSLASLGWAQEKAQDPLPSWNEGPVKQAIVSFVQKVTDKSGPAYMPPEDRIATFDQDGTTWVEHPLYTEAMFALDRVHELAPRHPEWKDQQPFKAVLRNDQEAMARFTDEEWGKIIVITHSGMTTEAFAKICQEWLSRAKHPRFKRPYTELVYQPMLEVMQYLRNNGFKTYIVTGFGQDFVRAYGEQVYGVPPEQVVGSSLTTKYECQDGKPVLMRLPKVLFYDNLAGKAIGINLFIGKRPLAAFGNSTGDQQMLEWTQAGGGAIISMRKDWKKIFAWE